MEIPRQFLLCVGRLPCLFQSCPRKRMVDTGEELPKKAKMEVRELA